VGMFSILRVVLFSNIVLAISPVKTGKSPNSLLDPYSNKKRVVY
jgi:hypothetical protein